MLSRINGDRPPFLMAVSHQLRADRVRLFQVAQLFEQSFLSIAQPRRQDHPYLGVEITLAASVQVWHALTRKPEATPVLRQRRNIEHDPAADRGNFYLAAKHRLRERNGNLLVE